MDSPRLACIHVGKTGGCHVHRLLRQVACDYRWKGHPVTLDQAARQHPKRVLLIGIRHPVDRFISAFNARQRRDHNPFEDRVFSEYPTVDHLVAKIDQPLAQEATRKVGHLPLTLRHYFGMTFSRHLPRTWIYQTESMTADMQCLFQRIGRMPSDIATRTNAAPQPASASTETIERLTQILEDDLRLYRQLQPLTLSRQDTHEATVPPC